MTGRTRRSGFTLVELLVATVIMAIVTGGVAVATLQAVSARDRSRERIALQRGVVEVCNRIAEDVLSATRSEDLLFARVLITDGEIGDDARDELLLLSRSHRLVRPSSGVPEGAEREIGYRVEPLGELAAGVEDAERERVWRRAASVPDAYLTAGGVARPFGVDVRSLSIEAYDGNEWFSEWDSDYDGYPHAVRVVVVGVVGDGSGVIRSVARRVVALDRTPAPLPVIVEEGQEQQGGGV